MKNKKLPAVIYLFAVSLIFSVTASAQNNAAAIAAADTTNFSKNAGGGWALYNSYLSSVGNDSVRLELILQQSNTVSWQEEQYIGKIKEPGYRPAAERIVSFSLAANDYELRIQPNGKCYLKLISGPAPLSYPVVIPFSVIYKK